MRKMAAAAALAAVAGLSVVTATPALATEVSFATCEEAAEAGFWNMLVGEPGYATHLDSDNDGVACEYVMSMPPPGGFHVSPDFDGQNPQIEQVPAGAPDTGVARQQDGSELVFLLAAGGSLVAAGAYAASRRKAAATAESR